MKDLLYYNTTNTRHSIYSVAGVAYCIRNNITGDCYVGVTMRKLGERINQHVKVHSKYDSSNCRKRTVLYADFVTYGIDNFTVSILYRSDDKEELLSVEKYYQRLPKFARYSMREMQRDTSKKHKLRRVKLISPEGTVSYFSSPMEVTKMFNCERSNIIRALNGEYLFKRSYKAEYVSEDEYQENNAIQMHLF